jgi:uncharacterized protein (DUF849 family)
MLLIAALNGGRPKIAHPAVPVSAAELADAARGAGEAGARAVHFHVRGPDGRESLAPDDVALAVAALRPLNLPFGVSTGAWIISDPVERLRVIRRWTAFPDFVSVNFDEAGAADLARHLLERGVEVEIGIPTRLAAEELVRSGLAAHCLRVMFEPAEQVAAEALATVSEAASVLDAASVDRPRLLHGMDATAWPLFDEAVARGYDGRVGFEDTFTLPEGGTAPSNGDLVRAARRRAKSRTPGLRSGTGWKT